MSVGQVGHHPVRHAPQDIQRPCRFLPLCDPAPHDGGLILRAWLIPMAELGQVARVILVKLSITPSAKEGSNDTAGGDALFTAKEARCFPKTAFRFACLPSARLSARQEVLASP